MRHLSPAELAEREGVPLETVYGWNKQRSGPPFMKIGRHVRYRLADVERCEESRTIATGVFAAAGQVRRASRQRAVAPWLVRRCGDER
jgi:predicted DNA-binding transcriptional regulator AlpA